MTTATQLDRTLHFVLETFVERGYAPHYTEIAARFGVGQPTQYRLSVDGRPGWFGQCGFESLAACWAFPGKALQIDSPCLDCGEALRVVVRDGVIERQEPEGIVAYVDLPLREWAKDWPFT